MVSHALWKTWPEGLSKQKFGRGFCRYWGPRTMFFTGHGRPWSNPTSHGIYCKWLPRSIYCIFDCRRTFYASLYCDTIRRHHMETFSPLLAICVGNSPVTGEFPAQRPVTRSFDVFFDLRPNKRLSKQWWGLWFETPSRPLWRHRNEMQRNSRHVGGDIFNCIRMTNMNFD